MHSPLITLNNGIKIPQLGLGVFEEDFDVSKTKEAVKKALEVGYRHIDTAAVYRNEEEVGKALKETDVPREEIFVTTKVWNTDQGFDNALKAYDRSLKALLLDYIDLYLVHWPVKEKRKDTWKALEKIYKEGRVRAIGVSNYLVPHLEELETYANVVPAVNQIEHTPFCNMNSTHLKCKQMGVALESYSPMVRGLKKDHPVLKEIAAKHQRSTFQILIRWALDNGVITIPKSSSSERIKNNFEVLDFRLDIDDLKALSTLHDGTRVADDPMDYL
ncbi:aldo/keto reductase [Jiulongibacter sediminis]|jgi:diketogulonate reductase-like aldo/keto reductase|uniref:aldo/keto reductase n=1 Tax=Jiulongibacter sediminis TaxID=1605367 RepID=UPI0026F27F5F|nr:aldo/keto reductase [Jiulongibacter sediminis]